MKMSVKSVIGLCIGFALSATTFCFAASEPMDLVDKNGTKLTARLISCDGKSIKVRRESDRKDFTIPLERLDDATSIMVKKWNDEGGNLSEIFEIEFSSQKNRKNTGADDFDDKRVNMEPTITLKNPDNLKSSIGATVSVVIFGRPILDTNQFHVFKAESFELKKLDPLASEELQVSRISAPYDDTGYAKFGARYLGYAVLIHNEEKTTLYTCKSVPGTLMKNFGIKLLKLQTGQTYTKDLKPVASR